MKSEEGEFKETCHLREGMSLFWRFEYQRWQLSSVTSIIGFTTSIANLASSTLYKLRKTNLDIAARKICKGYFSNPVYKEFFLEEWQIL